MFSIFFVLDGRQCFYSCSKSWWYGETKIVTRNSNCFILCLPGVRFTAEATDSSDQHEQNPLKTGTHFLLALLFLRLLLFFFYLVFSAELQWEQICDNECLFDLYFGILKLSHSYTMIMNVVYCEAPVKLEIILDSQPSNELQLLVTELPQSCLKNRISFQVEVVINPKAVPGPFHRTFLLRETSGSQRRPVTINVRGKILRFGQGTATLRDGVHMKSVITEKEDEE